MGISLTEFIVIFLVFLVLFGPEKLPEIASQIGRIAGELKKHSDALRREFYNSVYTPAAEIRNEVDNAKRGLISIKSEVAAQTIKIVADEATPPTEPGQARSPALDEESKP